MAKWADTAYTIEARATYTKKPTGEIQVMSSRLPTVLVFKERLIEVTSDGGAKMADPYFYVGEVPPPTPVQYVDKNKNLSTDIDALAVVAKCKIVPQTGGTAGTEFDVTMPNFSGGESEVQWADPSEFDRAGIMQMDIEVDGDWFLDRRFFEIRER